MSIGFLPHRIRIKQKIGDIFVVQNYEDKLDWDEIKPWAKINDIRASADYWSYRNSKNQIH